VSAVSVVLATYNRRDILASAIESVRRQDFDDWELIVVGDCCTDDSADVVAGFGDDRIRFHNLRRNVGEQSGPNNVGVNLARSPILAFINHDDLWFPDHLSLCLETLDSTNADLVFGANAILVAGSRGPDVVHRRGVVIEGVGRDGRYDPGALHGSPQVSSWVVRRAMWQQLGGMRRAAALRVVSPADFLHRAARAGFCLRAVGAVTVVSASSLERDASYESADARQAELLSALAEPATRATLIASDPRNTVAAESRSERARAVRTRAWLRILRIGSGNGRLPTGPAELDALLRQRVGPGELMAGYRIRRGLEPLLDRRTDRDRLRRAEARHAPPVRCGEVLDFRRTPQGPHRRSGAWVASSGWSFAEEECQWNDGLTAQLFLRIPAAAGRAARVRIRVVAHLGPGHPAQRVRVSGAGSAEVRIDSPSYELDLPVRTTRDGSVALELALPDAWAPSARDGDRRQIAIGLLEMVVTCPAHQGGRDGD
jgi:GT2 family glycosyltransferase